MKDPILAIPDEWQKNNIFENGNTGSGKSNTARSIVEYNLWKGRRTCIVDMTGDWWGLKSDRSGTKAGWPVIVFGGEHADIPIDEHMGYKLGELLATTNTPAVLDLKLFSPERAAKFLSPFFEALYLKNREVLHLVLDEAHRYIPQQPRPFQARLIHQVTDIVTGGRSRGFKCLVITQRPAKINKDPIAMCKTFLMHETTSTHDRKALFDMMEDAEDPKLMKQIMGELPRLPTGTAWVWSPKAHYLEKVKFPLAQTFDSGAAPEEGEAKKEPTKLAHVDLDAIRALLAPKSPAKKDTTKPAAPAPTDKALAALQAAHDRDVAALHKNYGAQLDQQNKDFARRLSTMKAIVEKGIAQMQKSISQILSGMAKNAKIVEDHMEKLKSAAKEIEGATGLTFPELNAELKKITDVIGKGAPARELQERPVPTPQPPPARETRTAARAPSEGQTKAEQAILDSLMFWDALGYDQPTREQVAAVAGYSPTSSSVSNSLGSLKAKGMIVYPANGLVAITGDGSSVAQVSDVPQTSEGVRAAVDGILDKAMRAFLDAAIAKWPEAISREEAANDAGYEPTSSSTSNSLGSLRTLEFISYPDKGMIRAADWFFPEHK